MGLISCRVFKSARFVKITQSFVFLYVFCLGLVSYTFGETSSRFTSSLTLAPGYRSIDYRMSGADDIVSLTLDLDADAHYTIDFETIFLRLDYSYNWHPFLEDILDLETLIDPRADTSETGSPQTLGDESRVLRGESDKLSHQSHTFAALLSLGGDPLRVDISSGGKIDLTLLGYLGTPNYVQAFYQPSLTLRFNQDTLGGFQHRLLGNWSYLDIDYDYLMSDIELRLERKLSQTSRLDGHAHYRLVDYLKRPDSGRETVILSRVGARVGFLGSFTSNFSYYTQIGFLGEIDDNRVEPPKLGFPPEEVHNRSNLGPILGIDMIYDVAERMELSFAGQYQGRGFLGWDLDGGSRTDHLFFTRIGWRQGLAHWVDVEAAYNFEADVSNSENASFIDQEAKIGLKFYFSPQEREGNWVHEFPFRLLEQIDKINCEREKKVRKEHTIPTQSVFTTC